ncbi:methylesterase 10-like isoform X2 [Mercurialis annua]|uniref:methylesterase 10-like isoform X2 n=1 Tax=Mercurialis annua TaxID=3986 RepID=UPI00215E6A95|nr:methylesterase 10-like isoform X2 [Mercurialis annua]
MKNREKIMETTKHFVLVHGASHGAWCWYKLVTMLRLAGHRATTIDLGGCGVNPKQLNVEVVSFSDYMEPLTEFMVSLPPEEKIILVGHSFGGFSISFAMEKFAEKILVAVFVTAYMPNCINPPATLINEFFKWSPLDSMYDCQVNFGNGSETRPTSSSFGPEFLTKMVYLRCPSEDLELGKMLVRPTGIFMDDLSKESQLTEAKFGSVNRVFVLCEEDAVMKDGFQKWLITHNPPKEVKCFS